jgi:pSer/pThr/pTyr-binding forkhead associated (FHA) protein
MPVPISTSATHRIRLVPHLDSRRSLRFDPITRDVVEGDAALRIGRFTERSGIAISQANALNSNKLAFKSKVVSRAHAEVWCEPGGKFFIKDTKSSSGTFLNHVRLSPANQDSRPFELKDGDTLQLGVDYQGGTEDIYKCVRIRVEIGREWQASANAFKYVPLFLFISLVVTIAMLGALHLVPMHCANSNLWRPQMRPRRPSLPTRSPRPSLIFLTAAFVCTAFCAFIDAVHISVLIGLFQAYSP